MRAEATRIIVSELRNGDVPAADKAYLSQLIATRTGISQPDAQKRVDDAIAKAKEAEVKVRQTADTARKTAATAAFFTAFSMLVGAFIAAVAATIAGHRRDESRHSGPPKASPRLVLFQQPAVDIPFPGWINATGLPASRLPSVRAWV